MLATPTVHRAAWGELDRAVLHDLLRLRIDVFVVEQACPYPELDGRDVEPGTLHWWTPGSAGGADSYLRTLAEPDGTLRVGRVCTRATARGAGLADVLLRAVLAHAPASDVVLDAQVTVQGWYARHGFAVAGPAYVEDGIPHVPMRLARA
jgi:ElaA protein